MEEDLVAVAGVMAKPPSVAALQVHLRTSMPRMKPVSRLSITKLPLYDVVELWVEADLRDAVVDSLTEAEPREVVAVSHQAEVEVVSAVPEEDGGTGTRY